MATTIDTKVVEMKFDNKDFEKNTRQTMSTLEKLKNMLHFKGASDGLEKVSQAARNVKMDGLANGIETVNAKFSAMDIIATTALVNITNSAVEAGKRLVASISTDQITAGWSKMEQQMSSMQTLMNSTGKDIDEIEGYLDELMWYSDETSYGFTDMTAALANMTATGGEIEKLVPMIMGIANATAYAGKGAAEFSRVIYNLNQSYGGGYLTLMDWKSVQLAGANSKQLTESLIRWGEELGTIKKGEVTIGNFNETLKDKWANTEVMENAFGEFADFTLKVKEAIDAGEYSTASQAIKALSKDYVGISATAFKAAQEAKSFSEAVDATKDAVSSGWMRVFKTIFGNYNEQKELWTDLANSLWDIFAAPIDALESFLSKALGFDMIKNMWDKINNNPIMSAIKEVDGAIKQSSRSLEEYQAIVRKVWRGDFNNRGDNPDRFDLLSQAGWDPRVVQSLVNKTDEMAGYGKGWTVIDKLTIDDVTEAEKRYGIVIENNTETTFKEAKAVDELNRETLKRLGLTEEQIDLYYDLVAASKKWGISIDDIIAKMEKTNGREHLEGSWREMGTIIKETLSAIGIAFSEVFHFNPINLYLSLEKLHEKLTDLRKLLIGEYIDELDENGKKTGDQVLQRSKHYQNLIDTLKGLLSVLKLIKIIVGGGMKIVFTVISTVLQAFGLTILDVTAAIGNIVTHIVDWIEENEFIIKGIQWLVSTLMGGLKWLWSWADAQWGLNSGLKQLGALLHSLKLNLKSWIKGLMEADNVGEYLLNSFGKLPAVLKELWGWFKETKIGQVILGWWDAIKNSDFGKAIAGWINSIGNLDFVQKLKNYFNSFDGGSVGKNIALGLWNGIKTYGSIAIDGIKNFGIWLMDAFKNVLGIHSPSKEFFYFGVNIVQGLWNGITSLVGIVYNLVSSIGNKMIEIVQNMDFGALLITALTAGVFTFALSKIGKIVSVFANGIEAINGVLEGAKSVMKSFSGVLKAMKFKIYIDSIKSLATALIMLVGCIVVLTMIDEDKMWRAIDGMWSLIGMVALLMVVAALAAKLGKANFAKLAATIAAVGLLFLIAGSVVKKMGKMDPKELKQGMDALADFLAMIVIFMAATKLVTGSKNVANFGDMMLKIGVCFYLMAMVVKKLGKLSTGEMIQGTIAIGIFCGLIVGLMWASSLLNGSKNLDNFGNMMMKVGVAFYLMAMTVKKLGKMDPTQLAIGMGCIILFSGIIAGLMYMTKYIAGGKNIEAIGKTIQSVGITIALMALAVKMLGGMEVGSLLKGGAAVAAFIVMILGLVWGLKKIGGKDIENINKALIGISLMIMSMAISCALLSLLDPWGLARGVAAVSVLSLFMIGLIKATKDSKDVSNNLKWLVLAVVALAGSVVALSLLDPTRMATSAAAMAILMSIFAVMIKMSKELENADPKKLGTNLGIMVGVIAGLALVVGLLSKFGGNNILQSGAAISLMAITLVGVLYAFNKMGDIDIKALMQKIGGLALLMASLYLIVGALMLMSGVDNVVQSATALTILIGGLTLVLYALTKIGDVDPKNLITSLAAMAGLIGALYLIVGVLMLMSGVDNAIQNAIVLGAFLGVLILATLAMAGVGAIIAATGGLALVGALATLALLIGSLYLVLDVIKRMNSIENVQQNVILLTGLMTMLTDMIIKLAIVGPLALMGVAALAGLLVLMPMFIAFATILGYIMEKAPELQGFLDTGLPLMIQIAGAMGEMIGAFVSGALTQISAALPEIGMNLSLFMINATPFIVGMNMVNGQTLKGTGIMAGCILALTAVDVINGIASFFTGGFARLGTELSQFAINALPFLATMSTVPPAAMNGVKSLAQAVLCLTAANLLDGLSRFFGGGGASLAQFGQQLGPLGTAMNQFITNLGVFNDDQVATVTCAGTAIEALAEAAQKLPKSGGYWQKMFGEGSLKDFAESMPDVADGVVGFVNNLGTFGEDQIATSNAACEVIRALAEAAKVVGKDGGFWQGLFGSKNDGLAKFAKNMPDVGDGVKGFIEKLEKVKDKADVAKSGAEIIESIAKLAKIDFKKANENLPKFGDTMNSYGDKLKNFIDKLKSFSKEDVETANGNLTLVTTSVQNMMNVVSNEINDGSGTVTANMTEVAKKAAEAIDSDGVIKTVKDKAKNFVQGFADGLNANQSIAQQAAKLLGQKANEGLSQGIDSHSPSKEAMARGNYFGEGFVIGIDQYSSKVYRVSEEVGQEASRGLSAAISKMSNLVDSDVGNISIRPVLDLSEIEEGANTIGSMFNNPSMQVAANLNSISSGMKGRSQNGNSEVVSAIDKLGKNLENNSGNTYNLGDISYNDDTAIGRAVQELVRAVEVERRV